MRRAVEDESLEVTTKYEDFEDDDEDKFEMWMKKKEAELSERRKRVQDVCRHQNVPHRFNRKPYMVSLKDGLVYCRNAKAGTTTWLDYFKKLSDAKFSMRNMTNKKLHIEIPPKFDISRLSRDVRWNFETASRMKRFNERHDLLSFSFVRHPFDRLVSTFENKFLFRQDKTYYRSAEKINGDFGRFIAIVIEDVSRFLEHPKFVIDVHWRPFYVRCDYCNVDFNVIGKVETFDEDVLYIVNKAGLVDELLDPDYMDPDSIHRLNSVPHDVNRTEKYFAKLSSAAKRKLYDLFRLDFELFGYKPNVNMN